MQSRLRAAIHSAPGFSFLMHHLSRCISLTYKLRSTNYNTININSNLFSRTDCKIQSKARTRTGVVEHHNSSAKQSHAANWPITGLESHDDPSASTPHETRYPAAGLLDLCISSVGWAAESIHSIIQQVSGWWWWSLGEFASIYLLSQPISLYEYDMFYRQHRGILAEHVLWIIAITFCAGSLTTIK